MEEWELNFAWLKIRHDVKDRFGAESLPDMKAMLKIRHDVKDRFGAESLPDMKAILFLIGIQELGKIKDSFTKEEKQDLMHIAVCSLLEGDGYYRYKGRDEDGWPHYETIKPYDLKGVGLQEEYLKRKVIEYFSIHTFETEEE